LRNSELTQVYSSGSVWQYVLTGIYEVSSSTYRHIRLLLVSFIRGIGVVVWHSVGLGFESCRFFHCSWSCWTSCMWPVVMQWSTVLRQSILTHEFTCLLYLLSWLYEMGYVNAGTKSLVNAIDEVTLQNFYVRILIFW